MTEKKRDLVEDAIDKAKPILSNLTFGAVMGYCSGVAAHRVGKALAVTIGVGFVLLQTAATFGYLSINWEQVRVDVMKKVDANNDGTVDVEDAKIYWRKFKKVLTHKLPSAGGFSLGFMYGVRG